MNREERMAMGLFFFCGYWGALDAFLGAFLGAFLSF